jgi:uncharacterized membrane protein
MLAVKLPFTACGKLTPKVTKPSRIARNAQVLEMPTPLDPDQLLDALPRSWLGRSGFVLLFLLVWFSLQFPLVPTTALGFAVNVAFALVVLGYAAFALRSIIRANKTGLNGNVKSAVGFILAASVGVAIFITAYLSRDFLSTNFGFHHIRELFH